MSEPIKAILWTGGDAPNKQATLTVHSSPYAGYIAFWEPGYCGCEDCDPLQGEGDTEQEAIAEYWEKWNEKYGEVR